MEDLGTSSHSSSQFNAGYSRKFTKQCLGRFYHDTTIQGATAENERKAKAVKKHEISLITQKEKLQAEIDSMELARKKLLRKQARELQRVNIVAKKVQLAWRHYIRSKVKKRIKAADRIRSTWIMFLSKREFIPIRDAYRQKQQEVLENKASSTISQNFQKYINRRRYQLIINQRKFAVIKIQSFCRGTIARCRAIAQKKEQLANLEAQWKAKKAATDIQRVFRGYVIREAVADVVFSFIQVQAIIRGFLTRRRLKRESQFLNFEKEVVASECLLSDESTIEDKNPAIETTAPSLSPSPSIVRRKLMKAVNHDDSFCSKSSSTSGKVRSAFSRSIQNTQRRSSLTSTNKLGKKQPQQPTATRRRHNSLNCRDEDTKDYSVELRRQQNYLNWFRTKKENLQKQAKQAILKKIKDREVIEQNLMFREDRAMKFFERAPKIQLKVEKSAVVAAHGNGTKKDEQCKSANVVAPAAVFDSRKYYEKMKKIRLARKLLEKQAKLEEEKVLEQARQARFERVKLQKAKRLEHEQKKLKAAALSLAKQQQQILTDLEKESLKKPDIPKQSKKSLRYKLQKRIKKAKKYAIQQEDGDQNQSELQLSAFGDKYDNDKIEDDRIEQDEEDEFEEMVQEESLSLMNTTCNTLRLDIL